MRGLPLVVLLAACESGVVLEVRVPPGSQATEVSLFLGLQHCTECPGIAPPRTNQFAREVLPGAVYYREDFARTAPVESDGFARFRIEANESDSAFSLAVAVDNLEESAVYIKGLSLDSAARYQVELVPARGTLGPKPMSTTESFVEIWPQPTGGKQCMGFERWIDGRLDGERLFIVPADDLDCDDITENECAPYSHLGTTPAPIEKTTCIEPVIMGDMGSCRPGGMACSEINTVDSCSPSEYCLSSQYCLASNPFCTERNNFTSVTKCLFDSLLPPSRITCTIGTKPSLDQSHRDLCTSAIPVENGSTTPAGLTCAKPDTTKLLMPRPPTGATELAFVETAQLTTGRIAGTSTPMDVRLRYEFDCKHKLELDGDIALNVADFDEYTLFAQIWVSQSAGPVRKLLIPIEMKLASECTDTKCVLTIDPTDSLADCLR